MSARGPLHDVRVLELAGLGPVPFAGMMFADMGADVILIDRRNTNPNQAETTTATSGASALYNRGKRSIAVDLKAEGAKQAVLKLVETADLLIEGYRPGVMERLGLGPEVCHGVNPGLVYGRMTGWGQSGPLAQAAGHDINYIALAGALYYAGADDAVPFTPPTLVGDVAGGAMSLAFGMMAALHRVRAGEPGQVVDAAICDGTAYLTSLMHSAQMGGLLSDDKTENFLTGASPWYNSYLCKDGKHITVGALEPRFYRLLIAGCGLEDDPDFANQMDKNRWPAARKTLAALFASESQDHWCERFEGTDVCFAPVLTLNEAAAHPHMVHRKTFVKNEGSLQPAPAPRLERTPARAGPLPQTGADTDKVLQEAGYSKAAIDALRQEGAI